MTSQDESGSPLERVVGAAGEETIESTEPARLLVTVEVDGERLQATVDGNAAVADVTV